MKALALPFIAVLVAGCQNFSPAPQPLVYGGGDGSSCEQAIVIREAKYRETGLLAERMWLEQRYPGYHQTSQSDLKSADRHYVLVEIATADGEPRRVYFDATDFIRK